MTKLFPILTAVLALCLAIPAGAQVLYEPEEIHYQAPPVPKSITFAGETWRFDRPDLYERLDREFINFTYAHTNSTLMLKRADRIFSQVVPILKKNGIPEDLKYLMAIESNLDPKAVSTAGAGGLWQFMKGTGRDYGLEVNNEVDERFHLVKATEAHWGNNFQLPSELMSTLTWGPLGYFFANSCNLRSMQACFSFLKEALVLSVLP